ncbi:MAG: hypothetical protein M0P71_07310 [Melioribacteraceae bacterium]|jgi:hypothetical protein|nr:hypothetical protein [Melioribacteraceae bacterium]
MAQHTKIKKGTVTIASTGITGQTTIDMELSTEDMRKMEHDYALGAGFWWTRIIPTIVKTNDAVLGAIEEPLVVLSNPSASFIIVRLNLSTNPNIDATYDVWLKYPHSISR